MLIVHQAVLASVWGQTFDPGDLAVVAMLVLLEATLSIDNALVLGVVARRVAPELRGKVLSYGLIGALVLRIIAAALAAYLLHWSILKLIGGAYLLWVAMRYFAGRGTHKPHAIDSAPQYAGLWNTILAIELTDMAFATDSILAAVALVGPPPNGGLHPKLWVIVTGGMLGVILMRFAAVMFSKLIERFPRLNHSAFLLVMVIGIKLVVDYCANSPRHPDRVDFQDPHRAAMWIFWGSMVACLGAGLIRRPRGAEQLL